jgi:hypothetical protein
VADDGLGDALGLLNRRVVGLLEEVERDLTAVELKGHQRGADVLIGRANVVQETGQKVCLVGELPFGELLDVNGLAYVESEVNSCHMGRKSSRGHSIVVFLTVIKDTHAVVEGLQWFLPWRKSAGSRTWAVQP